MVAGPPVCSIIPGCETLAKMYAAAPTTRSPPTAAASFSSLSTPFCSDTTAVLSCNSGDKPAAT